MSADQRFFDFLKARIGLDVSSVGPAIIERAVQLRSQLAKTEDLDHYWRLLNADSDEQQALIEAVIVPETWFFRYPESFVTLSKLALGRLKRSDSQTPLRILSLPCSTGEEPYSIAMALFDAAIAPQSFSVDAVDISPWSIGKARKGRYGKNSFRGVNTDFRDRYFSVHPEGFDLSPQVRAQVRLQSGNLLESTLLANEPPYDFVFCRNLLIYFDLDTQRRVFEVLKRLTRQDGVLFIGPAEGNLLGRIGMRSLGIAQSFAFGHDAAHPETGQADPRGSRQVALAALPEPVVPVVQARPLSTPRITPSPRAFAPRPPAVQVAAEGAEALIASIASLANEGRSDEARQACERYLQAHGPVAEVFYWLGLLSDVQGDRLAAQNYYRKVLYLQPAHPEALAQLAALLQAQGDSAGARRLHERAARGLNRTDDEREP